MALLAFPDKEPEKVVAEIVPPPEILFPPIAILPVMVPPLNAKSELACPVSAPDKFVALTVVAAIVPPPEILFPPIAILPVIVPPVNAKSELA